MSIRAGQVLWSADNGFLLDRVQSAAINVNTPTERIYEVGDFISVAMIRDIPDLQWTVDSYDMSVELEEMIFGGASPTDSDVTPPSAGTWYNYMNGLPIDIISPFRSSYNAFNIIDGVAIPQLYLESVQYKFAVSQSSSESWGFRGDSVYFIPGSPFLEQFTATPNQTVFTTTGGNVPLPFTEKGVARYGLNVSVNGVRKFLGIDYTESSGATPTNFTITFNTGLTSGDIVRVVYGSSTANTSFPTTNTLAAGLAVKPAAVRGRDINVYLQVPGATPDMVRWDGVQTANFNWNVNLQADLELGNYHAITEDYVTPTVKGDMTVKPSSVANLFSKIEQITGTSSSAVSGALTSQPLELEIQVGIPDTNTIIKTLYTPDARFYAPNYTTRVNTKLMPQFTWESDSGQAFVSAGLPPATNPLGNTI